MHAGIWLAMRLNYSAMAATAVLVMVDWPAVADRVRGGAAARRSGGGGAAPGPPPRAAPASGPQHAGRPVERRMEGR
jgi:hypothetical protein